MLAMGLCEVIESYILLRNGTDSNSTTNGRRRGTRTVLASVTNQDLTPNIKKVSKIALSSVVQAFKTNAISKPETSS